MTESLYGDIKPLLQPDRLLPASEVLADRSVIPDDRGIYGWWFSSRLPNVPLDGTLMVGKHRLLYVGIAPRAPSASGSESKSTLRRRITRNHLGNRIASSTLRRSLAWLLADTAKFKIFFNDAGKATMAREHEAALTSWMTEHAAISFLPNDRPWDAESELIRNGPQLPLNIKGSIHPFRRELLALRSSRGRSPNQRRDAP